MKFNEFELLGGAGCGIYKITNMINEHYYIGQTSRSFRTRWKEHIYAASCNSGNEQHTPLHQAIIKYGIENFNFEVLEQCSKDKLNSREQYWIQQLQAQSRINYNQTAGGQNESILYNTPAYVDNVIKLLKETDLTQIEISKICDCTDSMVSEINNGTRYYQANLKYPIRKTKLDNQVKQIAVELNNKTLTFQEIANKYGVSLSTVKRINKGEGRYHLDEYVYPIYTFKNKSEDFMDDLIYDLMYSSLSQIELAKKYNISYGTVNKTNRGERNRRENLDYPLRKK